MFSAKLARSRSYTRTSRAAISIGHPSPKSAELSRVVNNCRAICSSIHVLRLNRKLPVVFSRPAAPSSGQFIFFYPLMRLSPGGGGLQPRLPPSPRVSSPCRWARARSNFFHIPIRNISH